MTRSRFDFDEFDRRIAEALDEPTEEQRAEWALRDAIIDDALERGEHPETRRASTEPELELEPLPEHGISFFEDLMRRSSRRIRREPAAGLPLQHLTRPAVDLPSSSQTPTIDAIREMVQRMRLGGPVDREVTINPSAWRTLASACGRPGIVTTEFHGALTTTLVGVPVMTSDVVHPNIGVIVTELDRDRAATRTFRLGPIHPDVPAAIAARRNVDPQRGTSHDIPERVFIRPATGNLARMDLEPPALCAPVLVVGRTHALTVHLAVARVHTDQGPIAIAHQHHARTQFRGGPLTADVVPDIVAHLEATLGSAAALITVHTFHDSTGAELVVIDAWA